MTFSMNSTHILPLASHADNRECKQTPLSSASKRLVTARITRSFSLALQEAMRPILLEAGARHVITQC